jgi:hypothetical protein
VETSSNIYVNVVDPGHKSFNSLTDLKISFPYLNNLTNPEVEFFILTDWLERSVSTLHPFPFHTLPRPVVISK